MRIPKIQTGNAGLAVCSIRASVAMTHDIFLVPRGRWDRGGWDRWTSWVNSCNTFILVVSRMKGVDGSLRRVAFRCGAEND